jgi:hypothetical protein
VSNHHSTRAAAAAAVAAAVKYEADQSLSFFPFLIFSFSTQNAHFSLSIG